MTEIPDGAILQRDDRTLAIVPRTPVGLVTPEQLEAIAAIARRYEVPVLKITSGQRIAMVGIEPERFEALRQQLKMELGRAVEPCVHYVQACPGTQWCHFGVQDSIGLGLELEQRLAGRPTPAKLKIGVSGCNFCCAESYLRDVGLIATKKGWDLTLGGNSGGRPRIGDVAAKHLPREVAISMVEKFVTLYAEQGQQQKRSSKFVEKMGIDWVKSELGLD